MKKTGIYLMAALTLVGCLTACQRDGGLRRNAKQYIQAMADYDIDRAYPYATLETQKYTLDYFKPIILILDSSYIASNTPATITIDSITHSDDTSATVYFHKKTPLQPHVTSTVEMRLRDGQWLAHQIVKPAPMLMPQGLSADDYKEMLGDDTNSLMTLQDTNSLLAPHDTNRNMALEKKRRG